MATMNEVTSQYFKEVIRLFTIILGPRGATPMYGPTPLLCFRKHQSAPSTASDSNTFMIGSTSARKSPLVAELCKCEGPSGELTAPFEVHKSFTELGGHSVYAMYSEACKQHNNINKLSTC